MRIVTWNCCRGSLSNKVPFLDSLAADIAVVQECAKPEVECDTRVWFGDNPGQGIAVLASNGYQIRALPTEADVPKFVFPLEVIGPVRFLLLVVWSKGKQKYRYVMGIVKAVGIYTLFGPGVQILTPLHRFDAALCRKQDLESR